jgi:UDP-N-acetylmuramyl pentapeptide synthase
MSDAAIHHTADRGRLREAVRGFVAEGDVVLVKGSRGMRLDEVAADIMEDMA